MRPSENGKMNSKTWKNHQRAQWTWSKYRERSWMSLAMIRGHFLRIEAGEIPSGQLLVAHSFQSRALWHFRVQLREVEDISSQKKSQQNYWVWHFLRSRNLCENADTKMFDLNLSEIPRELFYCNLTLACERPINASSDHQDLFFRSRAENACCWLESRDMQSSLT